MQDQKTDQEIRKAEERVLFPETHTEEFELLGTKVQLRPLPLFFSKQISAKLGSLQEKFNEAVKTAKDSTSKDIVKNMDVDVAEALLDAIVVLCQFYKLTFTREDVNQQASMHELIEFAKAQIAINGENDFLLQPLRTITTIATLADSAMARLRSSLFTPRSASTGESASTS